MTGVHSVSQLKKKEGEQPFLIGGLGGQMSSKHGFRVIASLSHMATVKVRGLESYCWIFRCARTCKMLVSVQNPSMSFFAKNMA